MSNSFLNTKNITTNKLIIFLFLFVFIFVPYLIVFLLVGEINLLKLNWLVFANSENSYVFNLNILYIILGLLGLSTILFFIGKYALKWLDYDIIPFVLMTHVICITTIVTGLIPYNSGNQTYIIIARFVIVLIATLICFFVTNYFTNLIILNSSRNFEYYLKYKNDQKEQNKIVDSLTNIKKNKEDDFIEVERE